MALLQENQAANTGDGSTLAFTSNVSAGSGLVAVVAIPDITTTVVGITDTRSNTWALAIRAVYTNRAVEIWYAHNANAGANTLTFDLSAAVTCHSKIGEWDGFADGMSVDQTSDSGGDNTGTTLAHGTQTTTQATALAVAATRHVSAFTVNSVGDSFTQMTHTTRGAFFYRELSATATFDCDVTYAASETGVGAMASFYNTGGGGGGVTYPQLERFTRGLERGLAPGVH